MRIAHSGHSTFKHSKDYTTMNSALAGLLFAVGIALFH
jgi:hypothetical protein